MTDTAANTTLWPIQLPRLNLEVTLVLLSEKATREVSIWLVQAVPANGESHPSWIPIKEWTKGLGSKHQVMFWRRTVTPEQWSELLEGVQITGTLTTDTYRISLPVVARPPVLLPASGAPEALGPVQDESAWLWEWWDAEKTVLNLLTEERQHLINKQVRLRLGLDLSHWKDRVGNIMVFFPSGFRSRWHYDLVSHSLIVRTTLSLDQAPDYEMEVRGWEENDLMFTCRLTLERPSVVLPDVAPCDRFEVWFWRGGHVIHLENAHIRLKAITFGMDVHVGWRGGRSYTRRSIENLVGEHEVEPWRRLQRERMVDQRRKQLADQRGLKFYAPDTTDSQRLEAVSDLEKILNSARSNVRIWDPYFGTRAGVPTERGTPADDLYFIEMITSLNVAIRVLSSAEDWSATQGSSQLTALSLRLEGEYSAAPNVFGRVAWKAWVRAGVTTFHDRFVVVDDEKVWLLGSSINGLGMKHTTLVQVEYPQEILVAFDRIWRGETHGVGQVLSVFEPVRGRHAP